MSADLRLRYLADAVNTASPAQLIVMLYDRLGIDLERAAAAQEADDHFAGLEHVRHAQQIVAELLSSLDVTAWTGAADLAAVYGFLLRELIAVAGAPDSQRLRKVASLASGLRSSWHDAGMQLQAAATPAAAAAGTLPATAGAWVG